MKHAHCSSEPAIAEASPSAGTPDTPVSMSRSIRSRKSIREKWSHTKGVLGTPDYLACELLLGFDHGPDVDWWSLGICLYEWMMGFPPFSDESVEAIFGNILDYSRSMFGEFTTWVRTFNESHRFVDLEWDELGMSCEVRDVIQGLLNPECHLRLKAQGLKEHSFLDTVDWSTIRQQRAPFVPRPDDDQDTSYFDSMRFGFLEFLTHMAVCRSEHASRLPIYVSQ